jgi:uncharacterized paraquat-inducible protein A
MSAAVMDAPASLFTPRRTPRRRTLEDLLESRWRSALAEGATECPACAATMHAEGQRATCGNCGTTLA